MSARARHQGGFATDSFARRFVGAGLSIVDMVTDLQVIIDYLRTPGKEVFAYPLMGMVSLCLVFQFALVWLQTRRGSKSKMAKELLIVLSGLKPGFDAYQVAKGTEQSSVALLDPALELVFTKVIEMVAESIPGSCSFQFDRTPVGSYPLLAVSR